MFWCQSCGNLSFPEEPMTRVVVETIRVRHPSRFDAHRDSDCRDPEKRGRKRRDPGGVGTQIVREIGVCLDCSAMALGPQSENGTWEDRRYPTPESVRKRMARARLLGLRKYRST